MLTALDTYRPHVSPSLHFNYPCQISGGQQHYDQGANHCMRRAYFHKISKLITPRAIKPEGYRDARSALEMPRLRPWQRSPRTARAATPTLARGRKSAT